MATPQVVVVDDEVALAHVAADVVGGVVRAIPDANLTVATGRTPLPTYAELVVRRDRGTFDPSAVRVWQLDDYLGVAPHAPRSLLTLMHEAFLDPLGIGEDRTVTLPTDGDDVETRCAEYDRELSDAGGLDLALLGLGANGHLAFNEPPSDPDSTTRVVALREETRAANAAYWDGAPVPTHAVTMGLRQILSARTVLLLASGATKRAIVRRIVNGPLDPDIPASAIQVASGSVTVVVDRAAWVV